MGKKIIPPHDPERLAKIQDERVRMIGVDTATLEKQVQERRLQMAEAQRAKRLEEEQTLRWVAAAEWLHQQADAVRRHNAESTASLQLKQAQEKKVRDEALEALLRNRIEEAYFRQFGTSHR